ncbi:LANO_0H06788g1_1 [Lachancea nothofagi CBS 11611]|uniref:Carbonic anhydrase n=1 Tax=Lachancea nothofagi CBS 11611 TaxID=1266666 RepID=A0A1G4KLP0_9SACH|nr:LANO_0H06788g1_1 [Lachancea nothofagi CBS 11611]
MSPASTNIFTLTHNSKLPDLLETNEKWNAKTTEEHPTLFRDFNANGQAPHTLFIGCSDSRYNENCLGVIPGEIFTWKTIANIVSEKDLTCRATLEFAINVLKVNKVVLCGHTDCGGINTCLTHKRSALNNGECNHLYQYLQDLDDLYHENKSEVMAATKDTKLQSRMLSRLNVQKQVTKLLAIDTVKNALSRGEIEVYGLLYDVGTGLVEQISETTA